MYSLVLSQFQSRVTQYTSQLLHYCSVDFAEGQQKPRGFKVGQTA